MYSILLTTHSLFRWLVLLSLVYAIYRGVRGWKLKKEFSKFDNTLRHSTATITHIQLLLGLSLYFISPIVSFFLNNIKVGMGERQIRFFGLEHASVMFLAIVVVSIGSAKAKRKKSDYEKYRTMTIWFLIGLILILSSIPWSFSPLVSRPNFRFF